MKNIHNKDDIVISSFTMTSQSDFICSRCVTPVLQDLEAYEYYLKQKVFQQNSAWSFSIIILT